MRDSYSFGCRSPAFRLVAGVHRAVRIAGVPDLQLHRQQHYLAGIRQADDFAAEHRLHRDRDFGCPNLSRRHACQPDLADSGAL